MQTYPTTREYRQDYAEPATAAAAHHVDPYQLNLAGLIAFNPVLGELHTALGPEVTVDEPTMYPHPEVTVHRTDHPVSYDGGEDVTIKLDWAGATHVRNRGHELTDRQAAELLGISEAAFTRSYAVAAKGLRAGEAAMDPAAHTGPYETAASPGSDPARYAEHGAGMPRTPDRSNSSPSW